MTTKNMLGGALINYGSSLPAESSTPDGALFFKSSGGAEGLYIYRLIPDANSLLVGNQTAATWTQVAAFGTGINADTLDGLDSTDFQPVNSDLTAISSLSTTGLLVRTGTSTYAAKSIAAGSSKVSVTNGAGTSAGNISLDIVENQLTLSNLGGTLSIAKGGTGATSFTQGSVIYAASASLLGATDVGAAPAGSGTARVWQVLTSNGSGQPAWTNSSSLNVAYATTAASANVATAVSASSGTASNPSIAFQATSGTGIWLFEDTVNTPAQNEIRFSVGGTSRLRISETQILPANGAAFSGNGSLLTNLVASNLSSGIVPNGRISGEYTGFSNLTLSGTLTVGDDIIFTGTNTTLFNSSTAAQLIVSGGSSTTDGASIILFGSTATAPSVGRLRTGGTTVLEWQTSDVSVNGNFKADRVRAVSGSAVSPSFSFDSNTGAGMWLFEDTTNTPPSPSEIRLAIGGASRLAISATQVSVTNGAVFQGNGSLLTSLNASSLASGTIPDARLSGSYTNLSSLSLSGSITVGGSILSLTDSSNTVLSGGVSTTGGASVIVYGPTAAAASTGRLRSGSSTIVEWSANEVDVNTDLVVDGNLTTTDSAVIKRVIRLEANSTTGTPANMIIQGSTNVSNPAGGQITLGYGDGLGGIAAGSQPNSWAVDITSSEPSYPNTFRIFRVNAGGTSIDPLRIREASGGTRLLSLGVGTEPSGINGEIRASGTIVEGFSDRRLKTNIQPIENAVEKVLTLNGITYNANELAGTFGYSQDERFVGLFADEVEQVLPEAVRPAPFDVNEKNESMSGESYKTIQYVKLIPLLIEAIKQQQAQIDELKNQLSQA